MTAPGDIRRAAGVLFEPGQVVEVRALAESGRVWNGFFDDHDKMIEKIDALASDPTWKAIYWTINPVDQNMLAVRDNQIGPGTTGASADDIISRRWLLIDVDPRRKPGIMATDAEKAAAFDIGDAVGFHLAERRWPKPVIGDSGNGPHLLYRINLPNDADSSALVERCLKALSAKFNTDAAEVDTVVFDPNRISRVYGTPNRKGANRPDRPYRVAKMLSVPDVLEPVPIELLQTLAETGEPATPISEPSSDDDYDGPKIDLREWLADHADRLKELGFELREKEKRGHSYFARFKACPFSEDGHDGAYIGQFNNGATYAGCHEGTCPASEKNHWSAFKTIVAPSKPKKSKAKSKSKTNDEDETSKRTLSFFEKEGQIHVVAMTNKDEFGFIHLDDQGQVRFDPTITLENGMTMLPRRLEVHQDSGELMRVVGIPRADFVMQAPVLPADMLFSLLDKHLDRYVDMPPIEREMGIYYALFSWYYTKRSTSPYYRNIGDTGTGKSCTTGCIVDLCFLPLRLSGGSSQSAVMRQHEKWRGTTFIEEADIKGDATDPMIKWLNAGFERHSWIMLSDKNDPNKQQAFQPWGPKVLAMRTPFKDNATESRCLSYSPRETRRKDIPAELPKQYHEAVVYLRALIARFVLAHWQEFDPEWVVPVEGIEGRIRQMSEPVSCILQFFPDGKERYQTYVLERQKGIRQTRAESTEGGFFNEALILALDESGDGPPEVVTPRMVAEPFKRTSTAVTNALKSIGFVIERERIPVKTKVGDRTEIRIKQVRKLVVPSAAVWNEITSRYYYDEDGEAAPDCPDVLRGSGWRSRADSTTDPFARWDTPCAQELSQVSQLSQVSESTASPVTVVTVVTVQENGTPGSQTERYVHVQSIPHPCWRCGRVMSHYMASPSGNVTDPANRYLCKRCLEALSATPEDDGDEVAA